ncbi:MAG: class I SAM-dependent methyltransferase [Acidimicrobiales bacterium]
MSLPTARPRDGEGPVAPSHYFDASPAARSAPRRVRLDLPDLALELLTDRGVFSAERVDPGTKLLLLDGGRPPAEGRLLDLGCGYGPIAVAAARRSPAAEVWALDVNERARSLCAANAAAAGAANVIVAAPDDPRLPGLAFDRIYSNPPIRVGKAALHELLERWLDRLSPQGWATLVVHRQLGADSLADWLAGRGWPTTRIASRAGYRLLQVAPHAEEGR